MTAGRVGLMARPLTRPELVAYGLAACYLLNDTEELITYTESSRWLSQRLPDWLPVPQWMRDGVSQNHVNLGVALIGAYWVGAAVDGRRTGGRSVFFQDALWAWGAHGFVHVGVSALRRGYTSGVATAPVVIGYWWWAERTLRSAGVPKLSSPPRALGKGLAALAVAHGVAAVLERWLPDAGARLSR